MRIPSRACLFDIKTLFSLPFLLKFLLTVFLLTCCRAALFGMTETVQPALEAAASGSVGSLYRLGRKGGGGAWFALAASADHYGYPELAPQLLIRSARNDEAPFAARSLTSLLISDPGAIVSPLSALKRAERRYGSSDQIRQARIAVLADRGNFRSLIEESESLTGEAWEAPVVSAVLKHGDNPQKAQELLDWFTLYCPDPWALPTGSSHLFKARSAYIQRDYPAALKFYSRWLSEQTPDTSGRVPRVFAEMAQAARESGAAEEWAGLLKDSAEQLGGGMRYAALFHAGQLYRNTRQYEQAMESFQEAAGIFPGELRGDQAIWLAMAAATALPERETDLVSWAAKNWNQADRFNDRMHDYLYRHTRYSRWTVLERAFIEDGDRWSGEIRSQAAWILAMAVHEGRLVSLPVRDFLETAYTSAPFSWSGLRAAGLLGYELTIPEPETETPVSEEDQIIDLYLKWGLTAPAVSNVLAASGMYSSQTLWAAAAAISEDNPRRSIHVARRAGTAATRDELCTLYPLPYGELAAGIALEQNLPKDIFYGLIRTESAWDTNAVSRSGAQGLAQFMPATWAEWIGRLKLPADSDPMDPQTNLVMSAAYLDWLIEREWTDGWADVLVSYNAGGGRLRTWKTQRPGFGEDLFGISIPLEEPRSYISKVLSAGTIYGFLYSGQSPRQLHTEWGLNMFEVN